MKARQPTAVLIDDVSELRVLLRLALEDVGIDVVGDAGDGAAGIEVVAACLPDIVVLDISMPVMDGLTALPRIRECVPGARIVVLSAFDRELCEQEALSRGADAYVQKGHVDELIRTVLELAALPPQVNERRAKWLTGRREGPPPRGVEPAVEDAG